jgi:hypothetical protein
MMGTYKFMMGTYKFLMGTYKFMMGTYKFMMGTYKFMMGTYKMQVMHKFVLVLNLLESCFLRTCAGFDDASQNCPLEPFLPFERLFNAVVQSKDN